MNIETSRFGPMEVSHERVLDFPEGLPGFGSTRFFLVPGSENARTEWLQSADEPGLALLIIDPADLLPDYRADPRPAEIRAVQPSETAPDPLLCRIIVAAGSRPGEVVLNLFGPVLLNPKRRLGMQVPLVGSGYGVREIWPPRQERPEQAEKSEI